MKTLVLYESKFGNTHKIAGAIAEKLDGELVAVSDFNPAMLNDLELLVVGSPIHGWQPSSDTNQFLAHLEKGLLKGKFVAAFDTGFRGMLSGNAASRIIQKLEKAGGKRLLPTEKFVVEDKEGPLAPGEVERARDYAANLQTQFERVTLTTQF